MLSAESQQVAGIEHMIPSNGSVPMSIAGTCSRKMIPIDTTGRWWLA